MKLHLTYIISFNVILKVTCDEDFAESCAKPGPWFSRVSEEACDQVGGVWCDRPCIELEECLPDAPGFPQYALIQDSYDTTACQNARLILGLDHGKDSFHDTEICCAIQQAAEEAITESPSSFPSFEQSVPPTNQFNKTPEVIPTDCVLEEYQIEASLLDKVDGEFIATNDWRIAHALIPSKGVIDLISIGLEAAKDTIEEQRELQIGFAITSVGPISFAFGLAVVALKATMGTLVTATKASEAVSNMSMGANLRDYTKTVLQINFL
mmetsp:Transcript_29950/g.44531  ORF Transcript_29950/g.44531 Transcript_29950/m.44531 type:complete len:267 (-) Transcript_29950:1152-1952(-)